MTDDKAEADDELIEDWDDRSPARALEQLHEVQELMLAALATKDSDVLAKATEQGRGMMANLGK